MSFNLLQYSLASQSYVPVSILPRECPVSNNTWNQLKHHLWKSPMGVLVGLGLQDPRVSGIDAVLWQPMDKSQLRNNIRLSQPSVFMSQSSKDLRKIGLWHPRSFYGRGPVKFQLWNDQGKSLRHSLKKGPNCYLSRNSESYPMKALGADSAEEIEWLDESFREMVRKWLINVFKREPRLEITGKCLSLLGQKAGAGLSQWFYCVSRYVLLMASCQLYIVPSWEVFIVTWELEI